MLANISERRTLTITTITVFISHLKRPKSTRVFTFFMKIEKSTGAENFEAAYSCGDFEAFQYTKSTGATQIMIIKTANIARAIFLESIFLFMFLSSPGHDPYLKKSDN